MRVTKKSSSRVIFFAVSRVSRLTRLTAKKNYTTRRFFCYTYLPQKKIARLTAKKKITRRDDFFLHAFTAKIEKLHDLTAKKQLPILLNMHACRRCAHLWPRSGR